MNCVSSNRFINVNLKQFLNKTLRWSRMYILCFKTIKSIYHHGMFSSILRMDLGEKSVIKLIIELIFILCLFLSPVHLNNFCAEEIMAKFSDFEFSQKVIFHGYILNGCRFNISAFRQAIHVILFWHFLYLIKPALWTVPTNINVIQIAIPIRKVKGIMAIVSLIYPSAVIPISWYNLPVQASQAKEVLVNCILLTTA